MKNYSKHYLNLTLFFFISILFVIATIRISNIDIDSKVVNTGVLFIVLSNLLFAWVYQIQIRTNELRREIEEIKEQNEELREELRSLKIKNQITTSLRSKTKKT